MSLAYLIFAGLGWLWFLIAAALGLLLLLAWSYRAPAAGWLRVIAPCLKLLGVAALIFCLLEPLWSGQRARPGANLFAIIADNSQSLQIKDRDATKTRGELLLELLNPEHSHWQAAMEQNFDVKRFYFDARLEPTGDFQELKMDGRASAIGGALHEISERYHDRPLAGILLMTDGNATDIHALPDLKGLPPIYPVVLGSTDEIKDLALRETRTTQTDFEDAPVSIQADVSATGYRGEPVVAEVMDSANKIVAEQTLTPRKLSELLAFRFQLRPQSNGLSFYRVRVRAKQEPANALEQGHSAEATLANNSRVVVVERGHGPYRILYVAGRPTWEYKFLNRALAEDQQLQLVSLIRVANREPKFTFMGRPGESSNPLFRGFSNQSAEEIERYDQPVLVRLNTKDEMELRGGFPRTPEDLYQYQAVVVDHLEAEFFTPEQAALLQNYVSERGGGFLMLGGMESFQEGKYQSTPIGDMLPVYLERVEHTNSPGPVRFELTREGFLQSWARLRDNETDEKARQESMAPFQVLNRVREVKPGASVIATVTDSTGEQFPALAVQRFGRGHTAALMLGDIWRWGFHDAAAHQDMDKAWRQLMRWLVNDVPARVEVAAEPQPGDSNGAKRIRVRVRDSKFQPLDNAAVTATVQPVLAPETSALQTNAVRLQAEASENEPGVYETTYVPRTTAGYQVTVCVTNSEGAEVGRSASGWSTDLAAEEFASISPNVGFLQELARKTGGEIIPSEKLEQFASSLEKRQAPVMEAWSYPVWHTPVLFAFALLCFAAEWALRRWKGLP